MSFPAAYGARILDVARGDLTRSTPDRWLVGLRWVALLGMTVTIIGGKLVVPALRLLPLGAILVALALVNLAWYAVLPRRPEPRGWSVPIQIVVDVIALGGLLGVSGGLGNPFAHFLTFQIVLAGLLGGGRTTVLVTALALAVAALLSQAPPLSLDGARWPGEVVIFRGRLLALMALGLFLGFFVVLFARRLDEMRGALARSERLTGHGRIVAALCHELNTPLGTIVLVGRDLEAMARQRADGELEEMGRTVAESAQRASDIIGLLRGSVAPQSVREAVDLVAYVGRHAAAELDRLGYTGERRLPAGEPLTAEVLPVALAQVLANLLANAVDALRGQADGRIAVEVEPAGGELVVRIADNGPGLPRVVAERLGEPFQTTKPGGTGLGLYVSTLLAARMGGRLELDRRATLGATFVLTLPRTATMDGIASRGP